MVVWRRGAGADSARCLALRDRRPLDLLPGAPVVPLRFRRIYMVLLLVVVVEVAFCLLTFMEVQIIWVHFDPVAM